MQASGAYLLEHPVCVVWVEQRGQTRLNSESENAADLTRWNRKTAVHGDTDNSQQHRVYLMVQRTDLTLYARHPSFPLR